MASSLLVNDRYVEDGSMVGSLAQLREVVDIILLYGLVRGLHLSMVNSKDWNLRAAILDPLESRALGSTEQKGPDDNGMEPSIVKLGASGPLW